MLYNYIFTVIIIFIATDVFGAHSLNKLVHKKLSYLQKNIDNKYADGQLMFIVNELNEFIQSNENNVSELLLLEKWLSFKLYDQEFDELINILLCNNDLQYIHEQVISAIANYTAKAKDITYLQQINSNLLRGKILKQIDNIEDFSPYKDYVLYHFPEWLEKDYSNYLEKVISDFHTKPTNVTVQFPRLSIYAGNPLSPPGVLKGKENEGKMFNDEYGHVGYFIHLPHSKPKALVVWVYGGKRVFELSYDINDLTDLDQSLLAQDVAIAYLNTPEKALFSSLQAQQLSLSKSSQDIVHQTIHSFAQTLRQHPESLHNELALLKEIPFCLAGHSFGGLISLNHLQHYSDDFDFYLSINGGLSRPTLKKHDHPLFKYRWEGSMEDGHWLFPPFDMEKLNKPVLVAQNMSDNNVNINVALSFYRKAQKAKKDEYVKLFLFNDVSPAIVTLWNFGHGIPRRLETSFGQLSTTIRNFLLSNLTDNKKEVCFLKTSILTAQNYPNKSLTNIFLSYAYRIFTGDLVVTTSASNTLKPKDILEPKHAKSTWKIFYEPLLCSLFYLYNHSKILPKDPLKPNFVKNDFEQIGNLNIELVQESFKSFLRSFIPYVLNIRGLPVIENEVILPLILSNKKIQETYIKVISNNTEFFSNNPLSPSLVNLYATIPALLPKLEKSEIQLQILFPEIFPTLIKTLQRLSELE